MTRRLRLRTTALLAGGAFAVHQLRYLAGYGDHSHHELGAQGHAYMTLLGPLVAVVLVLALGDFCVRLLHARAAHGGALPGLRRVWAVSAGCLVAAYVLQESAEAVLSAAHPDGVAGVLGHGGWVALPLAVAIGLVVALAVRGAHRAVELAAEPPLRIAVPRPIQSLIAFARAHPPGGRRLARHLGGRSPPLTSVG